MALYIDPLSSPNTHSPPPIGQETPQEHDEKSLQINRIFLKVQADFVQEDSKVPYTQVTLSSSDSLALKLKPLEQPKKFSQIPILLPKWEDPIISRSWTVSVWGYDTHYPKGPFVTSSEIFMIEGNEGPALSCTTEVATGLTHFCEPIKMEHHGQPISTFKVKGNLTIFSQGKFLKCPFELPLTFPFTEEKHKIWSMRHNPTQYSPPRGSRYPESPSLFRRLKAPQPPQEEAFTVNEIFLKVQADFVQKDPRTRFEASSYDCLGLRLKPCEHAGTKTYEVKILKPEYPYPIISRSWTILAWGYHTDHPKGPFLTSSERFMIKGNKGTALSSVFERATHLTLSSEPLTSKKREHLEFNRPLSTFNVKGSLRILSEGQSSEHPFELPLTVPYTTSGAFREDSFDFRGLPTLDSSECRVS